MRHVTVVEWIYVNKYFPTNKNNPVYKFETKQCEDGIVPHSFNDITQHVIYENIL